MAVGEAVSPGGVLRRLLIFLSVQMSMVNFFIDYLFKGMCIKIFEAFEICHGGDIMVNFISK